MSPLPTGDYLSGRGYGSGIFPLHSPFRSQRPPSTLLASILSYDPLFQLECAVFFSLFSLSATFFSYFYLLFFLSGDVGIWFISKHYSPDLLSLSVSHSRSLLVPGCFCRIAECCHRRWNTLIPSRLVRNRCSMHNASIALLVMSFIFRLGPFPFLFYSCCYFTMILPFFFQSLTRADLREKLR